MSAWLTAAVVAPLLLIGSAIPLPPRHNPDVGPFGPDKFLHLVGHAGLAAALVAALADAGTNHSAVVAVVLSTGYGLGTECLQEVVPERSFEQADVVAGFLGSVGGIFVYRRSGTPSRLWPSQRYRRGAIVHRPVDA